MAVTDDRQVVYTTGIGRVPSRVPICKRCKQPQSLCRCASNRVGSARETAPQDGYVRIARDRKGRGGKTMTVITGLPGDDDTLVALAQRLKRLCGSGGTAKGGVVEIQGDHRDRIEDELRSMGYKVKRVGG